MNASLARWLLARRGIALFSCVAMIAVTPAAWGQATSLPDVELALPLLPETVPGTLDGARTALVVSGGGTSATVEPSADTQLTQGRDDSRATAAGISLRDNRFMQALFKFDVAKLPVEQKVEQAVFRFLAGKPERPGNGKLTFYRVLVDWTEDAGWTKPSPSGDAPK